MSDDNRQDPTRRPAPPVIIVPMSGAEAFETLRDLLDYLVMERIGEGVAIGDLCTLVMDPGDPMVPDELLDALGRRRGAPGDLEAGTVSREALLGLLGGEGDEVVAALSPPSTLNRMVCCTILLGRIELFVQSIQPLRYVSGGRA